MRTGSEILCFICDGRLTFFCRSIVVFNISNVKAVTRVYSSMCGLLSCPAECFRHPANLLPQSIIVTLYVHVSFSLYMGRRLFPAKHVRPTPPSLLSPQRAVYDAMRAQFPAGFLIFLAGVSSLLLPTTQSECGICRVSHHQRHQPVSHYTRCHVTWRA